MAQTFPLHERIKGTIAALRAHYSKSAAQAALADLEAALPLIEAPNGAHLSGFLQGLDAGVEVSQARAQPLPPDLVTRAAAVAHALEQGNADVSLMPIDEEAEIYGEKTVVQTAVKVLRDIIAAVEASADTTLETRFTEVHYAVDGAGGPRTVFRFEGLPDVSVPDTDADKLVARLVDMETRWCALNERRLDLIELEVAQSIESVEVEELERLQLIADVKFRPLHQEAMRRLDLDPLAERALAAAAALRKLGLGEPASSVVTGAADVLSEAVEALRGPESASSDPDLAERAGVMSTNLMTVLERWADAVEPVRSAIVTAAALFSEVAERLKVGQQLYWLVDEFNDTEGETFGIAVRASRDVDRALFKWARSYEAMLATERGETPEPNSVLNCTLTNGGDALTFRRGLTSAELETIENASDNDYGARVRILSAEGTRVLLDAINDTPPGGSLSLYKGTLSACMPELEDAEQPVPEPTELADLWAYEEKGAWVDDEDSQGPDDADGTEAAGAPVPDLPGTLEAVYHQQGWSLVLAQDGRATHLFRRDGEVGVMFVGPTACGIDVAGEVVKPLSERFDYPPHPELCGRCCAGANDQR